MIRKIRHQSTALQQNGEFEMKGNYGDRSRIMAECRRIQKYYPEAPNAQKCRRLDRKD